MNIVALLRVSTEQQRHSGLGLEAQHASIFTYAKRHGHNIVGWYTDAGVSGTAPLTERPALIEAMAAIKTTGAEALVVHKLDRLSRSPLVYLQVENTLAKLGATILSASGEGTEDNSPQSVLMRRILQAVAENEAAITSQRIKAALAVKKEKGERLGRPPYGLRLCEETDTLVPNKDFEKVEAVMLHRRDGHSYRTIAMLMNEADDSQTSSWSKTKVNRIVKRWKSIKTVRLYKNGKD
jgi:DNA invertase Pin-like site-specific DNA recombinase